MSNQIYVQIAREEKEKGKKLNLTQDEILENIARRIQEYREKNNNPQIITQIDKGPLLYGPPPYQEVHYVNRQVLYGPAPAPSSVQESTSPVKKR